MILLCCVKQKTVLHASVTEKEERMSISDGFINHILKITDKVSIESWASWPL